MLENRALVIFPFQRLQIKHSDLFKEKNKIMTYQTSTGNVST